MKLTIYILILLLVASCGQQKSDQTTKSVSDTIIANNNATDQQNLKEDENSVEYYRKQCLNVFQEATLYRLTDTITADFNGDGIIDKAFYKKDSQTSGIVIIQGQTNEIVRIGFGKPFAHMKGFNWVDYWALVEDRETSETTFKEDGDVLGGREVKLQNPSIFVARDEEGGGLITFRNGKYEWVHQAD
jgi:hypothetical protein